MGVVVFVSILLLFQGLRLTEFILIHGVKTETILRIMMYLSISFLPVILPMSLLFSVLLTYTRLSQDSEIVALGIVLLVVAPLSIWAFVELGCLRGTSGPNRYGPDPLKPEEPVGAPAEAVS